MGIGFGFEGRNFKSLAAEGAPGIGPTRSAFNRASGDVAFIGELYVNIYLLSFLGPAFIGGGTATVCWPVDVVVTLGVAG